jgi:hypothetical protein
MNINEYEELLNPKKEEEAPKEKPFPASEDLRVVDVGWAREYQQELAPPVFRTGMTVGTNESFMSQGRYCSPISRASELTEQDKLDVMNAAINFINNRARGMPYERQNGELLSREIHSYVSAYMYRWFPRIRNSNIVCDFIMRDYDMSAEFRIVMDLIHIGTMGVSVY